MGWRRQLRRRHPRADLCRDDRIALDGELTGTADFGTGPLTAADHDGFVAILAP
ncbi:hypothetical protein WMF38_12845 [Sorangium sp. So ce118]